MQRTVVVVSAGLGTPSSSRLLADRLAAASDFALSHNGEAVRIRHIELREHALDVAKNFVTGFAPASLQNAIDEVVAADGLIVVTPVFSASYSGLFKSFFDVIDPKVLDGKPVLLGATGGTARHSLVIDTALRPLFAYLHTAIVPTGVFAAPEDWGQTELGEIADGGPLEERIRRAAEELSRLVMLQPIRETPASEANPNGTVMESEPFEDLLAGITRAR